MLASPLSSAVLGTPEGFALAEWTEAPCPPEGPIMVAPLHLDLECDEAWIVLEGQLCVRVGDEVVDAKKGDAVLVPKGTPHTYWNPAPDPCRYILVMTALTRKLIEAIHSTDDRSREAMERLFEGHRAKLL